MLIFIIKRLFVLFLTMLCLSFIVFSLVTIEPNLKKLALNQANMRMEEEAVQSWLEKNGYKSSSVSWNFQKYLIGRDGKLEKIITPRTAPMSDEVLGWVEEQKTETALN